MYCKKCGSKIKKGTAFCGNCGYKLDDITEKVEIVEIEEKEKTIDSLTSNGIIYVVVALTMVLSFGMIIVCSLI